MEPLATQIAGQSLVLGVSVSPGISGRFVFELVDEQSRWPSPMWVGIIQPIEGLRTKIGVGGG